MRLQGETIKNAIVAELNELFPEIAVYKEEQTNPYEFPNFFVLQLSINSQEDRKDHYFETYLFELRYRHVADVELEPKIEQKLDNVGNKLINEFKSVTFDSRPYKIKQANYEKVDKVGHFTFQVMVQTEKEKEQQPLMEHLYQNYEIDEYGTMRKLNQNERIKK